MTCTTAALLAALKLLVGAFTVEECSYTSAAPLYSIEDGVLMFNLDTGCRARLDGQSADALQAAADKRREQEKRFAEAVALIAECEKEARPKNCTCWRECVLYPEACDGEPQREPCACEGER